MSVDNFGARLRELRESAGMSRKELAFKAGLRSEAGIRNLEQGIRKPAWETVLAICKALSLDCTAFSQEPDEDLPGKEEKPKKSSIEASNRIRSSGTSGSSGSKPGKSTRAKKPGRKKAD